MKSGGKRGVAFDDLVYLQLADRYGKDPDEIQFGWSERSINRMLAYLDASAMSKDPAL